MSKILKAGIIGCGAIGTKKHMPSLENNKNIVMTAFCDIIIERAEKAAAQFGQQGSKVYLDYKELLKDDTLDVIYVCTPNREHSFMTVEALESGKHVMCEKPMAKTAAGAKEMLDAANRSEKKLTIGYQNRFRQDSMYLKKMCERGDLGDIYYAEALAIRRRGIPTWGVFTDKEEQGGGPLIDIGTHALDLTLYMMNNYKPKMVVGKTFDKLVGQPMATNEWGEWAKTIEVEDSAFGFIVMENGAVVVLKSSWALNVAKEGEARTMLCGTKAGADMEDGLTINYVKDGIKQIQKPQFDQTGIAFVSSGQGEKAMYPECNAFIDAILNNTEVVTKPEQAYVVSQILEAIYESDKTGKPVLF